jgi:hypothetical protein
MDAALPHRVGDRHAARGVATDTDWRRWYGTKWQRMGSIRFGAACGKIETLADA